MGTPELEMAADHRFAGRTLGGYRVLRAIAAGGMATLYLARKTGVMGFAQNAALKIIHPHLAVQPSFAAMFLDEARIASCINHPNVCRVLDFGEVEDTYFLAMEYIRGESFHQVLEALDKSPTPAERRFAVVSWVLSQACEGLHAAHEAQGADGQALHIVHRDVSPHNLLVGYDGSVRIVDFGIAYAAERSQNTRDGAVKGRYAYMAPEQMRSEPIDRRADVWSLGVILREALTSTRLFARDTDAATIYAVTEQPLPAWPASVPLSLREVADKALARSPEARFATAREMGRALGRAALSQTTGSADLSQLMQLLFADRIAANAALIREIAQAPLAPVATAESVVDTRHATGYGGTSTGEHVSTVREVTVPTAVRDAHALRGSLPFGRILLVAAACLLLLLAIVLWPRTPSSSAPTRAPSRAEAPVPSVAAPPVVAPPPEVVQLEPEPQSAPPPPVAQKPDRARGTVAIGKSGGWAEVYLGKRRLGTTPLRVALPAGSHTLEVRPNGRPPIRHVRIEVRPREVTKVKL